MLQFPGHGIAELGTTGIDPDPFAVVPGAFKEIILFMISRIV